MTNNPADELMIRATWMYYHNNMTHDQIAQKLHTSRVKITRVLQKARETGIVEIKINRPLPINLQLAEQLEQKFSLKEAIVIPSSNSFAQTLEAVGRAAADYLLQVITPGCHLGFAWSSTLSRMAAYLKPPKKPISCTISDLAGSMLGQDNPYSVSSKVADILGMPIQPLLVPAVVRSSAARQAILNESYVRSALEHARKSQIAFLGLGEAGPDGTMVRTGYLTREEMADLRARGAVGDILIRYYDIHGHHIPNPMDDRIIGLTWEELSQIPHLVNVAVGPKKVEPILGILRSGLCDCLITDAQTAQAVLESTGHHILL